MPDTASAKSTEGQLAVVLPGASEFDGCLPKQVSSGKMMDSDPVAGNWKALYVAAGVASASEEVKKSLRCAAYVYWAKNGTSPDTPYYGTMTSGKGTVLLASEIPRVVGRFEVRHFARRMAAEAIKFFHVTKALELEEDIRAKCEVYGIAVGNSVALVDFLDTATGMTPSERDAYEIVKNYNIRRARAGRGGRDVGEVRDEQYEARLRAAGPSAVKAPTESGW